MGNTKVDINTNEFKVYTKKAQKVYQEALNVCLRDLARTSSESAPHRKGILEKSHSKEIEFEGNNPVGVVTYSVRETNRNGNFNYALKMHEEEYELGDGSRKKSGGTGMSGKLYPVGNGFLSNVLYGEYSTYAEFIEKELREYSRKF